MLGESRLNVYILGDDLSPRQRERIQAQVQTALRAVPQWAFGLLTRRLEELGVRNLPLVVEPVREHSSETRALSFGHIEERPAVRLMPRVTGDAIEWGQDQRYLVLKAVAYMASPPPTESSFWASWEAAVKADDLREQANASGERWRNATDLDLLIEMFAAYALNAEHTRWAEMPAVRTFFEGWR